MHVPPAVKSMCWFVFDPKGAAVNELNSVWSSTSLCVTPVGTPNLTTRSYSVTIIWSACAIIPDAFVNKSNCSKPTRLWDNRIRAKLPTTQRPGHQREGCRKTADNHPTQQSHRSRPDTLQDTQGTNPRACPHTNGHLHSVAPGRPNTIEVVYSQCITCVQERSNLSSRKLPPNQPNMRPLQANGAHYLPPHPRPPG